MEEGSSKLIFASHKAPLINKIKIKGKKTVSKSLEEENIVVETTNNK